MDFLCECFRVLDVSCCCAFEEESSLSCCSAFDFESFGAARFMLDGLSDVDRLARDDDFLVVARFVPDVFSLSWFSSFTVASAVLFRVDGVLPFAVLRVEDCLETDCLSEDFFSDGSFRSASDGLEELFFSVFVCLEEFFFSVFACLEELFFLVLPCFEEFFFSDADRLEDFFFSEVVCLLELFSPVVVCLENVFFLSVEDVFFCSEADGLEDFFFCCCVVDSCRADFFCWAGAGRVVRQSAAMSNPRYMYVLIGFILCKGTIIRRNIGE